MFFLFIISYLFIGIEAGNQRECLTVLISRIEALPHPIKSKLNNEYLMDLICLKSNNWQQKLQFFLDQVHSKSWRNPDGEKIDFELFRRRRGKNLPMCRKPCQKDAMFLPVTLVMKLLQNAMAELRNAKTFHIDPELVGNFSNLIFTSNISLGRPWTLTKYDFRF